MSEALLAALPIVAVLGLMLFARASAAWAGAAGLVLALVIAWLAFPFDDMEGDRVAGTLGALAEAAFTAGTIIWIILPALAIHRLQGKTGAVGALRAGLAGLSRDPRLTALLVAWFFALLLEGAAGFGTAAALAAPFLVALGMSPVAAVTAAMVGHTVGVTFGAVGTPIVPQLVATTLEPRELSAITAVQAALVGWSVPIAVAVIIGGAYRREAREAPRPRWLTWGVGLAAALAFLVPYLLVAVFVGPELPTLVGAIVGGGLFVAVLRWRRQAPAEDEPDDGPALPAGAREVGAASLARGARAAAAGPGPDLGLVRAMAPYLLLVVLVLGTRLLPPLRDGLRDLVLAWEAGDGAFEGSIAPLYHPGTMLFAALFLGAAAQGASVGQVRDALARSSRTLVPVAAALLAMLGLARVMVHAGMVESIATAAADSVGAAWPLLAPLVGTLGTFVTGSATASNALFSDLQAATATAVGQDVAVVLGAQGLGAALGNAVAPHNLIAAAAVVGLGGYESAILRRTLPIALPLILAAGLVALLLSSA